MRTESEKIFEAFKNKYGLVIGSIVRKSKYMEEREIKIKENEDKVYTGTLTKKSIKKNNSKEIIDNILLFKKNFNTVKIYEEIVGSETKKDKYYLILTEEPKLNNLKGYIKNLFNQNPNNLINMPFDEIIGNNFLLFLIKQIIKGLETLDRMELIHFNIKPENLLISLELSIKLSDFSLLRKVYNLEKILIPGGTPGYLSPDYYKNIGQKIPVSQAKKQDYFSLGVSLYFLKYGERMIKNIIHKSKEKTKENLLNLEYIVVMIPKIIIKIKDNPVIDRDFVHFLCSLIQIEPEDRPNFEEIYRNKWVNKNADYISEIKRNFIFDEQKLIIELRKSDFLVDKKQELQKENLQRKKFIFNIKKFK